MQTVSATDLEHRFRDVTEIARTEPVAITTQDRQRLVLLSMDEYERLKDRDRIVMLVEDLEPEWVEALEAAEVPPECVEMDRLLDDPQP